MHKILLLGCILVLMLSLSVYAANDLYSEDNLNVMVSKNNAEFTIKLRSTPSTGFSWFLREYDDKLLTPVKHVFVTEKNLAGAPGFDYWTFKMKSTAFLVPQQSILRLIYTRPFSNDEIKVLVFSVSSVQN